MKIGHHKYCFRNTCVEQPDLELGDRSQKIILSSKGKQKDISEELSALLAYVAGEIPGSHLTKRLDDLVIQARKQVQWRKEYMTLLERDERMREEGRKEGRKEGLEEVAKKMLKGNMPFSGIVTYSGLSESRIRELADELGITVSS